MAEAKTKMPPLVQMYDRSVVREYLKRYTAFIFSWEEVVRTDQLENHLELHIKTERTPDKIYYNGELCSLTPLAPL